MNITIESHVLNHNKRSGLMTYTEGLVYGMQSVDHENQYSLLYYSLSKKPQSMPGPEGGNFRKIVLRIPDREFYARQLIVDNLALPLFFKTNKTRIFHRTCGYTMPCIKSVFKILTVHDLRTLTIGDETWKQNIDHYRKTLQTLDLCVVVSECTKQDLLKHFQLDEKKIKVIYLGADKRFRPSDPNEISLLKNKYDIKEPFLLSIGSVDRKNIDGIIRGFAMSQAHKNFILVLSCNMDVEKYLKIAAELGISNRIKILSQLTDQEVVALYGSCHAFVFPSHYEGFGLPILEAMQCGAPVITSNVSSCPEVAGNAAILVDPNNVNAIAHSIDQICTDSALRQDLIQKGSQRCKLFSWDNYAKEMKKIYQSV